jgi:TetR/AcrR family transcriptional regulator
MAQPAPEPKTSPKSERTRAAILDAAERLFAERGFAATRLEDVAEAVGIRRASIVYYFRDKRVLYEAVLAAVFGGFREELERALAPPGKLLDRIERAVLAFVDYVAGRPALARILLREVADGPRQETPPAVLAQIQPFVDVVERFRKEVRDDPLARSAAIDPVHLASAIVGTTVFFVAAMPKLVPPPGFDPRDAGQHEAHRREILRITRRLLGAPGPRPVTRREP